MTIEIRPYLNRDSVHCGRLWNEHFGACGLPADMSREAWDDCVASKAFFDPELCLVASRDGRQVGFALGAYACANAWGRYQSGQPLVNALCLASDEEDATAIVLLEELTERLSRTKSRDIYAFGGPFRFAHLMLIPPTMGLMGVHVRDERAKRWLSAAGFGPHQPTDFWQLPLIQFRPPVDRGQISVRRSAQIGRMIDIRCDSDFVAQAFGHTDQIRFHLSTGNDHSVTQEILFHVQDLDQRFTSLWALLQTPVVPADPLGVDRLVYLIAESLRQLQYERYQDVYAVTSAENQAASQVFQKIGFHAVASGMVYRRAIASDDVATAPE